MPNWSHQIQAWPCRRGYSGYPRDFLCWGYGNESVFRLQSKSDADIPPIFVFQATVYKQTNAIQNISISTRTASNFLASEHSHVFEAFWICWMIVPILLNCDKSSIIQFNKAPNSATSKTFSLLPIIDQFSRKSPFLKRWNHSRKWWREFAS